MAVDPFSDPLDPAYRPPLEKGLPFPPSGEIDHPNLKELLYANLRSDQTVVDVGCGTGPFEYHRYEPRFIAFDMFEPDSKDGLKAGSDEFRLGKLDTFPIEDECVDAVVMGFILEHVEHPEDFLQEAYRVLKPGGWVYVAVPDHRALEDRLFRLATRLAGSTRGPHIQKFTPNNLRNLAKEKAGLEPVAWHPLRASWLWLNHPRLKSIRKPFLKLLRVLPGEHFAGANIQMLLRKPLK